MQVKKETLQRRTQFLSLIVISVLFFQVALHPFNLCVSAIITSDKWVTGVVFPSSNITQVKMFNADILFEINAEEYKKRIHLSYEGNYTIQNLGEELNISLIAPFRIDLPYEDDITFNLNERLSVRLGVSEIPFNVIHSYATLNWTSWTPNESPINNTLGRYWEGFYVITNITLLEDSMINIYHDYSILIERKWSDFHKLIPPLDIAIIIGTLKAWQEEITARARVIIKGKEPTYYSDYNEEHGSFKECNVTELKDGTLYEWNWKEESVQDEYIVIYYSDLRSKPQNDLIAYIVLPISITLIPIPIIVLIKYLNKRKLK